MILPELHPHALDELEAAVRWHEQEQTGLGVDFYLEVRRRLAQAVLLPRSGAPVTGFDEKYDVRAYNLKRFRYRLVTTRVNESLVLLAVAHTSREPDYWKGRLNE